MLGVRLLSQADVKLEGLTQQILYTDCKAKSLRHKQIYGNVAEYL